MTATMLPGVSETTMRPLRLGCWRTRQVTLARQTEDEFARLDHLCAGVSEPLAGLIGVCRVIALDARLRNTVLEAEVFMPGALTRQRLAALLEDEEQAVLRRQRALAGDFAFQVVEVIGGDGQDDVNRGLIRRAKQPARRVAQSGIGVEGRARGCAIAESREVAQVGTQPRH